MFTLNDVVTWTHPRTGVTRTGLVVGAYRLNGSTRYVVRVWRPFASRPRHYRPNPAWLKKLR